MLYFKQIQNFVLKDSYIFWVLEILFLKFEKVMWEIGGGKM